MRCQECNQREATVQLCQIVGDQMTKRDLCEVCGKEFTDLTRSGNGVPLKSLASRAMEMTAAPISASHSGYAGHAYLFVQAALRKAQRDSFKTPPAGAVGYISAGELLEALRRLAIESFGRQAKARLNSWGIFECEDFGEIVFHLIKVGLLTEQETDTRTDFQGGYDFATAFPS